MNKKASKLTMGFIIMFIIGLLIFLVSSTQVGKKAFAFGKEGNDAINSKETWEKACLVAQELAAATGKQKDTDADGIIDACDNCPECSNKDQKAEESDGDYLGIACDPDEKKNNDFGERIKDVAQCK